MCRCGGVFLWETGWGKVNDKGMFSIMLEINGNLSWRVGNYYSGRVLMNVCKELCILFGQRILSSKQDK